MPVNLTEGSVFKNIAVFSTPYFIAYFLQTLYGLADLFVVGQFEGAEAITAVAVGSQVMHFLTVMIVGLAMGTTVLTSRAVGAGNLRSVSRITGNTIVLFSLFAVILTAVLLLLCGPIVSLLKTPAEAVDGTVRYLQICFAGIPFIVAYNLIAAIFRGMGDSKHPMYFIAVACVLNIILDYVFMGGMRLGAAGAALATVLAQSMSVLVSLFAAKKLHLGVKLCRRDCGKNHHLLIPGSIHHSFDDFRDCGAEHGSRKARAGEENALDRNRDCGRDRTLFCGDIPAVFRAVPCAVLKRRFRGTVWNGIPENLCDRLPGCRNPLLL